MIFLIELLLRTLPLCALTVVATWVLRRRCAAERHLVLRMVLAGMIALPILAMLLPPMRILPLPAKDIAAVLPGAPAIASRAAEPSSFDPAVRTSYADPTAGRVTHAPQQWPVVLIVVYCTISAWMLLRTLLATVRAMRIAAKARPVTQPLMAAEYSRPKLRESSDVAVPCTIGWMDPIIVLPKDWRNWEEFKVRSVLWHELAHVRRGDWVTSLAAAVNRAVFWCHPLAWWLDSHLSALAEEACDASAIRSTGDGPRYARVVLDFARAVALQRYGVVTSMIRTSRLGRRLHSILDNAVVPQTARASLGAILMIAVTLPTVYVAAAVHPVSWLQAPIPERPGGSEYSAEWLRNARLEIFREGWHTKPEEIGALESELAGHPDNVHLRGRLLSFYTQQLVAGPRTRHLFWMIEHHPDADIFRTSSEITSTSVNYTGLNTLEDSERARNLWWQQIERSPSNTRVLVNAALSMRGLDDRLLLDLLRRARALNPNDTQWVDWIGAVYARAVRATFAGGPGQIRIYSSGSAGSFPTFSLPLDESERLKKELETSTDGDLLKSVAEALVSETMRIRERSEQIGPEAAQEVHLSETFGRQLAARALLNPMIPRR